METSTSPYQTADASINIQIRFAKPSDIPFICDSWTKMNRHIYPNNFAFDYVKTFSAYVARIIAASNVFVAVLDDAPDEIISYLIYTFFRGQLVVHFAYTKLQARHNGFAQALLNHANLLEYPVVFTHPPRNENSMIQFSSKYIFDPNLLNLLGLK